MSVDFFTKLAFAGFCWGFTLFFAGTFMRDVGVGSYNTAILTQRLGLGCLAVGTLSAVFS